MGYPCYKVKNEKEYRYIKTCLNTFGYNTKLLIYYQSDNYIVLDCCGKFGIIDNVRDCCISRYNRYEITNINDFLIIAAKLKKAIFNPNKTKTNMENNKPQAKEPKIGDKVLVKNKVDQSFQMHIYIGKIHNKYACVNKAYEYEFNHNCPVLISFWDEMVTKFKVTKAQIADKFGVSVDMFEIVD